MSETTDQEEKEYIIDHGNGVKSTVKSHPTGHIIVTDHGVTDKDGNPKISVHIQTDGTQTPFPAPGTIAEAGI